MDALEYDVVVIGVGSTGENVADRAVKGGLTAAIVESDLVGGDCSYWACMPSKALLRPGRALGEARDVKGAREAVTGNLNVPACSVDISMTVQLHPRCTVVVDERGAMLLLQTGMTLAR